MTDKFRARQKTVDTVVSSLASGAFVASERVQRDAGKFGNGLITDPAVITRGEARGHNFWIDSEMVASVASALLAAGTTGIKSRLGHPSWTDDKTGRSLGRFIGSKVDGDTARAAGLHLTVAASKSPGGDLADWLLTQAWEDAEAIGASIEFEHDDEAEIAFLELHGAEWDGDEYGRFLNLDNFVSPDPLNADNMPHGRMRKLRAIDIVDTAASNPQGLLSEPAQLGDAAKYILGISDELPAGSQDWPAESLREQVAQLMDSGHIRGEDIMAEKTAEQLAADRNNPPAKEAPEAAEAPKASKAPKAPKADSDSQLSETPETPETPEVPAVAETPETPEAPETPETQLSGAQAIVKQFSDRFGSKGMEYLSAGLTLDQAQGKFNSELVESNQALTAKLAAVEAAGGSLGDAEGVSHSPEGGTERKKNGMIGLAGALQGAMTIPAKRSKS